MLKSLRDLLGMLLPAPPDTPKVASDHVLHLATAVMLVEVMRADAELGAAERSAVVSGLREAFGLDDDELARLVELGENASRDATDYFSFTSTINERFDPGQKAAMIEAMWRVAYADGTLGAHENHLMRRAADLLHVPHGAYVAAKLRARRNFPVPGPN